MTTQAVTLHLPEDLYLRLQQVVQATRQSFDAVVGSVLDMDVSGCKVLYMPGV